MSDDACHLQALLKNRDCYCPNCGYNLRWLTSDVCSECGTKVNISDVFQRQENMDYAWLVMLVTYAAALPWSLFFVWQRLLIRGKIHYGDDWNPSINGYGRGLLDRPPAEAVRMFLSTAWWLSVPFVLVALLIWRRRVARWPKAVRWLLAGACMVMVVLAYRRWQWWWFAFGFNGGRYPDWPWWYIK